MYYQVMITPDAAGGSQWDTTQSDDGWDDEGVLLQRLYSNRAYDVYDLDQDILPAFVEDIRGRVRNEPPRILALVREEHGEPVVQYVGITGDI